jgi:DNA-binding protein H-NS
MIQDKLIKLIVDLDNKDLNELIEIILAFKEKRKDEETEKLTNDIQELINKSGIPLNEILPKLSKGIIKKTNKSKAKPKYQNPDDTSQTWSGRGKTPLWARPHKENGTLETCLI